MNLLNKMPDEGEPPAARPAGVVPDARALAALSRFAAANADRLSNIDVNPLVVWGEGKGGAALDALVTPAGPADR